MKFLTPDYEITRDIFNDDLKDCSDFLLREAVIQGERCFFCVMDGLINSLQLSQMVTKPILTSELEYSNSYEHLDLIKQCVVGSVEMSDADSFEDCYYYLMSGFALFYLDGCSRALVFGIQGEPLHHKLEFDKSHLI